MLVGLLACFLLLWGWRSSPFLECYMVLEFSACCGPGAVLGAPLWAQWVLPMASLHHGDGWHQELCATSAPTAVIANGS